MGVVHYFAVSVECIVDKKAKDSALCVLETALAAVLHNEQCALVLLKTYKANSAKAKVRMRRHCWLRGCAASIAHPALLQVCGIDWLACPWTACRACRREFWSCFALQDQKEGMAAFIEKRKPAFQDK